VDFPPWFVGCTVIFVPLLFYLQKSRRRKSRPLTHPSLFMDCPGPRKVCWPPSPNGPNPPPVQLRPLISVAPFHTTPTTTPPPCLFHSPWSSTSRLASSFPRSMTLVLSPYQRQTSRHVLDPLPDDPDTQGRPTRPTDRRFARPLWICRAIWLAGFPC